MNMTVYVRFHSGSDITVHHVCAADTKNGNFVCYDEDGDKLFVADERNILYVEYSYE